MVEVRLTVEAQSQIAALPTVIQARIQLLVQRLARWPQVSGVKPLRAELRGAFRVRTGDFRVLFTVDEHIGRLTIFRVANRRDVYDK
jgi:mRNA interferase RelE/StbE